MSYNVYHTDGSLLTTVNDGSLDTSTSLNLVGRGYAAYAEIIAEDFVRLMENFASTTSPLNALVGQLWWDKTKGHLNVYDGTLFKSINPTTVSNLQPNNAVNGDFWLDTVAIQLKTYIGSTWYPVSPLYTASQGKSGPIVGNVTDNRGNVHSVTSIYNSNNLIAVYSTDSTFTPISLDGIWNNGIIPGITFNYGYAVTAPTINTSNLNATTLNVNSFSVTGSINPSANLSANIGSAIGSYFNYIYGVNFVGTSSTAKYADLAEMYRSDKKYESGTVVVFGGEFDITVSEKSHNTAVAGIISQNPAYLMNDNYTDTNWLPVALTGRVPCNVLGPVNKGTVLVNSNISGIACAIDESKYKAGCVIGKSLENIDDDSIKTIEVSVGRF
jgi:hypothetical protein